MPSGRIFTQFGSTACLADVIYFDKFVTIGLEVFILQQIKSSQFSHVKLTSPLRQCCKRLLAVQPRNLVPLLSALDDGEIDVFVGDGDAAVDVVFGARRHKDKQYMVID